MKFILTILTFFALTVNAQDSLFWSGNRTSYVVQKGTDTFHWQTIGTTSDTFLPITGPTYYYRVYSGHDTSKWLYAYDSVVITPIVTSTISYFKAWQRGHNVKIRVTSDRTEQAILTIRDMMGYIAGERSVTLLSGTNDFSMPAPVTGLYVVSVETKYEIKTQQIFIR